MLKVFPSFIEISTSTTQDSLYLIVANSKRSQCAAKAIFRGSQQRHQCFLFATMCSNEPKDLSHTHNIQSHNITPL
jgi:hydrogenase maturation factor